MEKAILALENKFANVRAGRANPGMLTGIMVDYYGTPTPIQNLANVTVSGNSLVLGSLNSGSISVTSNQASTISSPGQYELSLVAKPADGSSNFSISQESLYPQKVKVTVDKYNEATYPILDNVKYKIGDGYFGSTTTFAPETINISGPETVMNKVAGVRVDYTIDDTLTSSKTITAPITVYDIDGNALSDSDLSRLTISSSEVSATIQVLKKSTVPLVASFSNVPAGFDINSRVTVTPSSIDIAGPEDVISKMKNITLPTIDLSTVDLTGLLTPEIEEFISIKGIRYTNHLPSGSPISSILSY